MTEIIEYINNEIESCVGSVTTFGLCHLIEDKNGIYPATVEEDAEAVTPNDGSPILIYHRLLNGAYVPREDLSFGRTVTAQNAQRVRTVVFIDLSASQTLIDDIINALPDVFTVNGYQFISASKTIDLIRDRNAIWEQEFGESYKSRFQKRYQIYALEYNLEYIKCPVCETSPE